MDTSDTGSDNSDGDDPDGDGKAILSDETLERLASKMQAGCSSISAEDLPPHELKALERAAASGRLDRLLDPWHPWWLTEDARQLQLSARGTRLVSEEPSARSGGGGTALLSAVPAAPAEPLPSLKDLTRGAQPSPSLKWHLVDITYAYCCTLRHFDGDCGADPAGAAAFALSLSAVLRGEDCGSDSVLSSGDGLPSAVEAASRLFGIGGRAPAAFGCSDAAALLGAGRPAVVCALWDLRCTITAALEVTQGAGHVPTGGSTGESGKRVEAKKPDGPCDRKHRRKLIAAQRKLLFFTAW
eukprot:CAMPEP_0177577970 /NCGR_PEP_ID=MMETSP0419_2-20121207/72_1 /TAXON_ID=582737 /ORGANISM="Tetraselmis sp., Strain GSL018" /LENGTH=298 /DNA_ID=CAMNT_0019066329 /DNA_START=879 /DNA_END=1772 /DNA_ORIENTATION=-